MSELLKPTTEEQLPRPFESVGELGWASRARDALTTYGVPLPVPETTESVALLESRLGVGLPQSYRCFLLELGAVDLDAFRFLSSNAVTRLNDYWARTAFAATDLGLLDGMVSIVDYCGTSDPIALQLETGRCARCGHDPPGLSNWLPSFDAVLQLAFMALPVGYYGWDDQYLEQLVADAQVRLFGTNL